jgi:endonuclease-3
MNAQKREIFYQKLAQAIPEPTTELDYSTDFELLISVILSAQSTDVGVNKATKKLYKIANTPEQILSLGEEGLKTYIKTIGLYHSKAKNIINTCAKLIQQHQGEIPQTREELEALPGVGRKTANVVLNTAFGQPTMAVDTHIFRVSNRTGLAPGKTPLIVEEKLLKVTPPQYLQDAHHLLILHGRYTCKARQPQCETCIVWDECTYKNKINPLKIMLQN